MSSRTKTVRRCATHRPATRQRRFRHDDHVAVDLFSGFGGLSQGIEQAGFTTILAANHNSYKVEVHEANHPNAEHWIADLVDPESADYHSARDLPPADLLVAGVSCVNHSPANTKKAYAHGLSLFDLDDPDWDARVTRSERDRATANCFPAGTVVVARRGMVPIEELVVGDEVLTHWNRWRRVTGTMSRHAPLVTVKGRGHTAFAVTANHRFLTRSATLDGRGWKFGATEEWTNAGELVGHAWQSPIEFPDSEIPEGTDAGAPDGWEYDADFWWTVGRWLGDGWIRHCIPSGMMVGICCGYAERAELDGRWPTARVTEAATTVQYELRGSGPLARWLTTHFGEHAHGKTIPTWALSMDVEWRKALIDGYMSADGCSLLDGRRGSCATVSRRLAVGIKLLLQTLGYRPTLGCRAPRPWNIEGRTGTTRPMWVLQWMAEQRRASTIATIDGRAVGTVRSVTPAGEAEVFDIEVEEDHSFVADGMIVHNCVLHYAAQNHPLLILVECTTELTSWGPALPGRPKVGDGSTFRWWLKQFRLLDYQYKILYLNSMFFGVGQSRNRLFIPMWKKHLPAPDLEHRPASWCGRCDRQVDAVWTWRTGVPPTGTVRYGSQYDYRCPRCRSEVVPAMTPALDALDLTNLGARIGERDKPLAAATMARIERCRKRFAEFPAILMPAKSTHGTEKHPWQPMATQTSQQETAMLSTGSVFAAHRHNGDGKHVTQPMDTVTSTHELAGVFAAVNNYQGGPRGLDEPLPTQVGGETLSVLSSGVIPFRKNTIPTVHAEPMPTATSDQIPGLLTAAGVIKNNGAISEAKYRSHPVTDPLGTLVSTTVTQSVLFSGWRQQHNATLMTDWAAALAELTIDDLYFRMLGAHEVGRGCGFDTDFPGHKGEFIVWGSARDQVDGFGNAVSPSVGAWISARLRPILDRPEAVA